MLFLYEVIGISWNKIENSRSKSGMEAHLQVSEEVRSLQGDKRNEN